jgi:hypothetical protein
MISLGVGCQQTVKFCRSKSPSLFIDDVNRPAFSQEQVSLSNSRLGLLFLDSSILPSFIADTVRGIGRAHVTAPRR